MNGEEDRTNTKCPGEHGVPLRVLGRTGAKVSVMGLGGFHLGKPELTEEESIRIIRTAIDNGITFLDNCWDYNEGQSEIRMGKALRDGYRERAFLMTKIDGRDRISAASQIDESLRRLRTGWIDLLQFHEIIHDDDPERIFARGGTLEAVIAARSRGKIRYIGFTGHKSPEIHLGMLRAAARHRFRFDTVKMTLNVMDAHFESFEQKVLPVLQKEGTGVLGMKPMGRPGHYRERYSHAGRMPALRDEPPDQCGDHRLRFPSGAGAGSYGSPEVPSNDR